MSDVTMRPDVLAEVLTQLKLDYQFRASQGDWLRGGKCPIHVTSGPTWPVSSPKASLTRSSSKTSPTIWKQRSRSALSALLSRPAIEANGQFRLFGEAAE